MIEVRNSNFQNDSEESSFPFVSVGITIILLLISIGTWILARDKNRELKKAYDQLICYYLQRDYTRPSPEIVEIFPEKLRNYAKKATEIVEKFYRDQFVRDKAQEWLSQGSGVWDKLDLSKSKAKRAGKNCLEEAIAAGKFGGNIEKRIWTIMALKDPLTLREDEERLQKLEKKYIQLRDTHPYYGWGIFGKFSPVKLFSSIFINQNPVSSAIPIISLAILGIFIEFYWGFLTLLLPFFLGGLVGNITLFFINSSPQAPILGSEGAILAVTGFFIAASWKRKLILYIKLLPKKIEVRSILLAATSILFAGLSLFVSYGAIGAIITTVISTAAGLGLWFALVQSEQIQPLPEPTEIPQKQKEREKKNIRVKYPPIKTPDKPASTLRVRGLSIKNRPAMIKADSKTLAEEAYKKEDFSNAVTLYRELYLKGEATLDDFEKLFDACKKSGQKPTLEDYLRALRTASFEKQTNKVLTFYEKIRSLPIYQSLHGRERISIARSLEKVELYREALHELEEQLKEGPDSNYYIDALLAKAYLLIRRKTEEDLEELVKVLYRAELFAKKYPQYQGLIQKVKTEVEKIQEEENLPLAAPISFADEDSTKNSESDEKKVDEEFLKELEKMMNIAPSKTERDEADESWAELPLLMLKRENTEKDNHLSQKEDSSSNRDPQQLLSLLDGDPFLDDPFLSIEENKPRGESNATTTTDSPFNSTVIADEFSEPPPLEELHPDGPPFESQKKSLEYSEEHGEIKAPNSDQSKMPNAQAIDSYKADDPSKKTLLDPDMVEEIKKLQYQLENKKFDIFQQNSQALDSTLVEMPKIQEVLTQSPKKPNESETLPLLELTEVVESDEEKGKN